MEKLSKYHAQTFRMPEKTANFKGDKVVDKTLCSDNQMPLIKDP